MKERSAADGENENPSTLEALLNRGMSPKDAMLTVIDMLMAGIDTVSYYLLNFIHLMQIFDIVTFLQLQTSHTTSFLFYFLAKNPEKQEKLRKEILSVVGPKGNNVTLESLNKLNYLKACIKESLRLRPAVMGNGRILGDDLVLSGYNVKKGVSLN